MEINDLIFLKYLFWDLAHRKYYTSLTGFLNII